MARLKFSISLANFKILIFFNLWALRVQHLGGADFRRKAQNFAENHRKLHNFAQARLSHLVCPV